MTVCASFALQGTVAPEGGFAETSACKWPTTLDMPQAPLCVVRTVPLSQCTLSTAGHERYLLEHKVESALLLSESREETKSENHLNSQAAFRSRSSPNLVQVRMVSSVGDFSLGL